MSTKLINKERLELFSDGVLAIIITIMVLEIKAPHEANFHALADLLPTFISYVISFHFVGLYWMTHNQLFALVRTVNVPVLGINLLGLFGQSLIPFATAWMGENHFADVTVAFYSFILVINVLIYMLTIHYLARLHRGEPEAELILRNHPRNVFTLVVNILAIAISLCGYPICAFLLVSLTGFSWLMIPGKKLTKTQH